MKLWHKILLIAFHLVMLGLFLFVVLNGLHLRWRLGYILFGLTALSGMAVYFIRSGKSANNIIAAVHALCWMLYSVVGIFFTILMFDAVYCETDKYIMKEASEIIGFDTAILYEKKGLFEVYKQRYKFVYPESMIPLDSIGAIVIYGDYCYGDSIKNGVALLPLDESFDKEKAKEYALSHNIEHDE